MDRRRLVVGIGNALHGADGFGPAVIAALQGRADLPADARLVDAHTDLLNYLDTFAAYDEVVLIDAFVGGAGTGRVFVVEEDAFGGWASDSPDSHGVSAVLGVALFRRLYADARTRIVLVGLDAAAIARDVPLRDEQVIAGVSTVLRLLAVHGVTPRAHP